jgi:hypothetical protein
MVSATPTCCTPISCISRATSGHPLGRDLALVGAAHSAGDGAAHLDARRASGLHHRAKALDASAIEQLMFFWLKASLAAPNTTISSGRDFTAASSPAGWASAPSSARQAGADAGHHLGVVSHLRHPLGRHKAGDFDLGQPGRLQAVHQLNLVLGGHRLLFVLQAISGADLDEFDAGRRACQLPAAS